jgi:uncharacterized circularly permuted ATP-grasp superfamily protein/uncharacterized alpha-E superfamily protein
MSPETATPIQTSAFRGGYRVRPGWYDEMMTADGQTREHWRPLVQRLDQMGPVELERRWRQGQRLIQDNGVTYNVYGDPRGMDRPWVLDPLPLIISPKEWGNIEAGLIQRASLLNQICADLYGPQSLLQSGQIPAELVLRHPNFLRPCHNLKVSGDRYVTHYAADIARSRDGRWWVLNDRAQAPSGAGYALENRLVMGRMLPGIFRDCGVARLARFFSAYRETLRAMSPRVGENPRIVLLTPGPFNETFFEHAYLARYMGLTLVQGDDLTVRDNKVFLKTLGGLRRVDVILRRLDDSYCDPLELRGESAIGVPGLVQAAWSGNVAIANALGTGLLETAGLLPFFPGLCRTLLGEEEKLPSVATWWCGQPRECDYVIEHLEELVVKPAFPGAPAVGLGGKPIDAVFGDRLSREQRGEITRRILDQPQLYAAQECVPISTAPVLDGDRMASRHVMLRVYVAATHDGGYTVMPGGLTRVSMDPDSRITSMQRGGGSKDTWVLSDQPVSEFSLIRDPNRTAVSTLSHDSFDLSSRVADNLYWLGRYLERGENLVRLLRSAVVRLTDDAQPGTPTELPMLLHGLDTLTILKTGEEQPERPPLPPEARVLTVMFDRQAPFGLADTLGRARRLASIVRDRMSLDAWRILSQLDREYQEPRLGRGESLPAAKAKSGRANPSPVDDLADALDLLDRMVITLAAFTGLGTESMLRSQGWRFLDMGRRIERAMNTVDLLRAAAVRAYDSEGPILDALLEVMASAMSYRQRYLAVPAAVPMFDMLLLDETNPRSVAFQLAVLSQHLDQLPRQSAPHRRHDPDQRLALSLLTRLRLSDAEVLAHVYGSDVREELDALLQEQQAELPRLSDAIAQQFLSHNVVSRRLGDRSASTLLPTPGLSS